MPTLLARVSAAAIERARAEATLAKRYAPRFNAVSLLAPSETRLSEVFKWLLDGNGSHGQGATFRERFVVELLNEAADVWIGAEVLCEVPTIDGRGRIDHLMVSRDGSRCIVIENKPWAGWQENQLLRYWDDQVALRTDVRIHALMGGHDAEGMLKRHWEQYATTTLPSSVTASGFGSVASWLESCATATNADRVRAFLLDLADYCRHFILGEPSMNDVHSTADLILSGGEEALRAAHAIGAALPLALTRDVAIRIGGSVEDMGYYSALRVEVEGVMLAFVLFDVNAPWGGVIDHAQVAQLRGDVIWGTPERCWPRWAYIKKLGERGRELVQAAAQGDTKSVSSLIPAA